MRKFVKKKVVYIWSFSVYNSHVMKPPQLMPVYIAMNEDCQIIEDLRSEIRELKSRNRRMYYFLDELRDDIQYEHGFDSKCYETIHKFIQDTDN